MPLSPSPCLFCSEPKVEVLVGMAKNHNADIVLYGRHNDRYSSDGTFVGASLSKPPITGVFTDEPFRTHFSALATS